MKQSSNKMVYANIAGPDQSVLEGESYLHCLSFVETTAQKAKFGQKK